MTTTLQSPAVAIFHRRARSIYDGMKKRAAKLYVPLPFEFKHFEDWLLQEFWWKPEGTVKCSYGGGLVTAETFCVEHKRPIVRGGSFAIENLAICSEKENLAKGNMTAEEYRAFKQFVLAMPSDVAESIFRRLQVGDVQRHVYFRKRRKSRKEASMLPT